MPTGYTGDVVAFNVGLPFSPRKAGHGESRFEDGRGGCGGTFTAVVRLERLKA